MNEKQRLVDIVNRQAVPSAWSEGDNIPWNDPAFSERMLREHLTQKHNAASRRSEIIDQHVAWIDQHLLSGQPSRILDLGCGPGLYAQRLTALGHTCTGIDYSPASIAYARNTANESQMVIDYVQEDIRRASFPAAQDLVMFTYGEFDVFSSADAQHIISKAWQCLRENGQLLIEVHSAGIIQSRGEQPATWYSAQSGLWSDQPYLCLQENFWDATSKTTTIRYFIIDADSGQVEKHCASYQGYTEDDYVAMLAAAGFKHVTHYPSLSGVEDERQSNFRVLVTHR